MPRDVFDVFTVTARPERKFISSPSGTSGAVTVFKRISSVQKEDVVFDGEPFNDSSAQSQLEAAINSTDKNIESQLKEYIKSVDSMSIDTRLNKTVEVIRFTQSFDYTYDSSKKNTIRKILLPYYRIGCPEIGWGYTNYCTLHFPNNVGPSSASIIYPNPVISEFSNRPVYTPEKDFTIEFYVKPSYSGVIYAPGTIMHMSSCFSISIISGSIKNAELEAETFKLLLQLSHSADVSPRDLNVSSLGSYPLDLAFTSDDEHIKRNNWHHVAITWSPNHDNSTGSFYVDGNKAGSFYIPDSVIPFTSSYDNRSAIFVGNFYEGRNITSDGPHGFFSKNAVDDEGVTDAFSATSLVPAIPTYAFRTPFKGEIHELRIWNKRRDINSLISGSINGVELQEDLLFYVPPFFRRETKQRKVLYTPFESYYSATDDPVNVKMSFSVAGHHINIENHTREFVKGYYPRLLHLTSSELSRDVTEMQTANDYLYSQGSTIRRNLTILPCDNGKFFPNFSLLLSGTSYAIGEAMERFIDDEGFRKLSYVNMNQLVDSEIINPNQKLIFPDGSEPLIPTPEYPKIVSNDGIGTTVFQKTGDGSSNNFTTFAASNLFYGGRITEGSFEAIDTNFSGSNGTLKITIKDNKRGSLYRADASSIHASWASVGFILYPEGISTITSPYLGSIFGKDNFEVNLLGKQSVHVLEINAIAPAWSLNNSRNPNWKEIRLTDYVNDKEPGFVSINRVNFHDENLNIVAKVEMARPINKRYSDRIMFRTKFDF